MLTGNERREEVGHVLTTGKQSYPAKEVEIQSEHTKDITDSI